MGADLLEADLHLRDEAAINLCTIAELRDVALCVGKDLEELLFERGAGFAEELGGELEDTAGVGDDLHGLDAGDLVEEPSAGGVHELRMAFELHQLERSRRAQ